MQSSGLANPLLRKLLTHPWLMTLSNGGVEPLPFCKYIYISICLRGHREALGHSRTGARQLDCLGAHRTGCALDVFAIHDGEDQ